MKILVVIPKVRGYGVQRVVSLLSREWAKSHEVTIATFDASEAAYDYGGQTVDLLVPMLSIPFNPFHLKGAYYICLPAARLVRLIRHERPDRIISFIQSANIPAIIASALTGYLSRLTVSVRVNPAKFSSRQRLLMFLLYRLSARIVPVSEGVKRELAPICRLPLERISFIPNPIVVKNTQDAAREMTPPLPERYVLGVGRLVSQKGFERLLRAFHRLDRPALHLAILGEGSGRTNLLRLACELGLESRLHLPGRVADVETWYRHAACFVLSSRYEGWPNVLGEALANGCPVVSFDCDHGPSEILEDGKYGLLVPEGDVAALTGEIARVLDDDALRQDLVAKGPERARMFNLEKIAPRWLEADAEGKCA